jgi:glutaredoxin
MNFTVYSKENCPYCSIRLKLALGIDRIISLWCIIWENTSPKKSSMPSLEKNPHFHRLFVEIKNWVVVQIPLSFLRNSKWYNARPK